MEQEDKIIHTIRQIIQNSIPIADSAMQIKIKKYHDYQLYVDCPATPNQNDKTTLFAGSIFSAMTLAGWGLCMTWSYLQQSHAPIVAATHCNIQYLAPITTNFTAIAKFKEQDSLQYILNKGRGRVPIEVIVQTSNSEKSPVIMQGEYHINLNRVEGNHSN